MSFDDLDLDTLRQRSGEKWQSYGDGVLAAWVADMDFPPAEPIRRALAHMLQVSDTGYPLNPTSRDLPTLFSERAAKRYGLQVEPRRVEVITDVVQGLYVGQQVFSQPGDGVVIQTPIYPPFLGLTAEMKRTPLFNPLVQGRERYEIDFEQLRASIDANTRVLMLCNPHNPTGRVLTRAELQQLAEICIEHDLIVLSDEIHADLVYPGHEHVPIATLGPEIEARTVTFMSASKAFNIAGLRCAVAAFGSVDLQRRFNQVPRHMRGGLGAPGLAATRVAWQECGDWLAAVVAYLRANRDFTSEFLAREMPDVRCLPAEGTYLAWLDCRALGLEPSPFDHFLTRARVALSKGDAFGPEGAGFVRINFATSRQILTQVLERMAKSL